MAALPQRFSLSAKSEHGTYLTVSLCVRVYVRGSFRKIPKGGGGGAKAHRKAFWGGVRIVLNIQF